MKKKKNEKKQDGKGENEREEQNYIQILIISIHGVDYVQFAWGLCKLAKACFCS